MIEPNINDTKYKNFLSYRGDASERIFGGFTCSFRQWRAKTTHCQYLHSYVLTFRIKFDRDVKLWFRSRDNTSQRKMINKWFRDTFNHKTFIAEDDPFLSTFKHMNNDYFIRLKVLPQVGCEVFAKYLYTNFQKLLSDNNIDFNVTEVEVFEYDKNSAIYKP